MRTWRRSRSTSPSGSSEVIEPADRAAFERAIERLTESSAKLAAEVAKTRRDG